MVSASGQANRRTRPHRHRQPQPQPQPQPQRVEFEASRLGRIELHLLFQIGAYLYMCATL